jgi:GAF domain-containing protein/anti-sigma regulatory factor (Ser/Thr protein kinase)/ActR/RegA family two-component response regulator
MTGADRLRQIARLARTVVSELDLETVLSQVTAALRSLRPDVVCAIRLVDSDAGGYRLAGTEGFRAAGRTLVVPFGEGLTHVVAETRRPLLVENNQTDPRAVPRHWSKIPGLTTYYGVPIDAAGELFGVVNMNFPPTAPPTEDEQASIEVLAAQAAVAIRNARLFTELDERRRAAEALAEVSRALAQTLDADVIAQQVVDTVRHLLSARGSFLFQLRPDTEDLIAVAVSGEVAPDYGLGIVLPDGSGLAGVAVRARQVVVTPDLLTDARVVPPPDWRRMLEPATDRAALAAPLIVQDRVIGALSIRDRTGRVFSDRDRALAQAFADQVAVALENARLHRETERRRREAEELARIARALTDAPDETTVADRIVQSVLPLFGVQSAILRRVRPDGALVAISVAGRARDYFDPGHVIPRGVGLAGRAVAEGRPIAGDVLDEPDVVLSDDLRRRVVGAGIRGMLAIPLRARSETLGVLALGAAGPRRFSASEVALLDTFADQAALALHNAQVLKESKARQGQLEALLEVTRELSAIQSVESLLDMIAETCGRLLDSESVGFRLLEGDELVVTGMRGDAGQMMNVSRLKIGESLSGIVAATGEPLVVTDIANDPRVIPAHRDALGRAGYKHWLGVPVQIGGRLVGVLSIRTRRDPGFSERDLAMATAFAAQAAIALQTARLYSDAERRRQTAERLADVGRLISQSLDLQDVAPRVVNNLRSLIPALRVALYRIDPTSDDLLLVADSNDPAITIASSLVFHHGTGLAGLACQERRLVVTPNILTDSRFRLEPDVQTYWASTPIRAAVAVPLLGSASILGVLIVADREARIFADEELRVLEMFAAQATVALDNARLFLESETRRRTAEALAEVGRVLSQALEPGEVAQRIADSVCGLLGCQASALFRLEPSSEDLVRLAVSGDAGPLGEQVVFPKGVGVVGLAVRAREPVVTADLLADPRVVLTPELRGRIEQAGYRAVLVVPLLVQDRVIGALAVGDQGGRRFDREQVQLAQSFADQAALALENARLYAEAKHAYEELLRAQSQLVRVETLRAVGELAAGASHHLNNLLAVVLGRLQLALKKFHDPDLLKHLIPAERAAQDGAEVVARLLRFSRGPTAPTLVGVDLNELAGEVIELTRSRWQGELVAKGIAVNVRLEPGSIPEVAADPPSLREVLVNLILNAADAMPSGGRITITTWAAEGSVYCRVSDTGIGMSLDVQRRAREPFYTTKGVKSTGLGLSVNYGILQRHGGDLTIESVEGRGTDITVRLPAGRGGSEPQIVTSSASAPPGRILLVDDESEVRAVITDMLVGDGHEVIAAANGADGLAQVLNDPSIDLVLTDLGMPGMSGWELAQAVKTSRPLLPVGIITGWGEAPETKPEERAWADFVLSKPITQDDLRSGIAHARLPRGVPLT